MSAPSGSSGNKGFWVLGGVAVVFIGLVAMWLGSFGSADPAVSADPVALPGVRVSPFDSIDDDGTVVLQLPNRKPEAASFELGYVIPTSVPAGASSTIGLFGSGFPDGVVVASADPTVTIVSSTVKSPEHIEVEIQTTERRASITLTVSVQGAGTRGVELTIEP